MSTLGEAVNKDLARRGFGIEQPDIEKILLDANVSSAASRGVPTRLRIRRVRVTGTKRYTEALATGQTAAEVTEAPIDLDWKPRNGVNGVGSDVNLRGKSSVLHFAMWALTGRSHLQADVLAWVGHVSAEFHIDGVPLFVEFDMMDRVPSGSVKQGFHSGQAVLGTFSSQVEFESLMGSVMLDRLRLDVISVFSQGVETEHAWPSFAAALTVHADRLDPIVGNENTLKTRILQMFVGTRWAAVDAQVATALNALTFERKVHTERRQAASSVTATAMEQATNRAMAARAKLDEFDKAEPNVDTVFALASTASLRAREAHALSLQLMTARTAMSEAQAQLRAEEMRRQAAAEDAVARRLFNGMAPKSCPRCSTKVPAERYAAEVTEHECSVCTQEFVADDGGSETDPVGDAGPALSSALAPTGIEDDDDGSVDPVDALREAVAENEAAIDHLQARFRKADRSRADAETAAQRANGNIESARARLQAEFELARAESALETLQQAAGPEDPAPPIEDLALLVLETASKLTKKWVKDDQTPLLESVSTAIADLARQFGSTNISAVSLKGNGNMDVHKGGASAGYSLLTNGEKLRIKLATAIALIEVGHREGVGRHPGLLLVDSPASEEIPEADLRTMLKAMASVAEKTELQILVATTHGQMLRELVPADNLLVATGDNFLW